jgi:hypothetical protein
MRNARLRVNIDRPVAFGGFKAPRLRSVARYGDRPKANVFTRLTVGIVLVAALLATEAQTFPVGCRDMATGRTAPARVTRTNRFQFDTNSGSLVGDLESHIGIRPAVDFGTQVFPLTQRTVSYIAEFFDHDAPCSNLNRVADQCLGGDMQEMPRYGSFMPGHPLQESPGTSSANGLNSGADAPYTRAAVIQHPAVEEKCLGICRVGGGEHPLDAHIHANNAAFGLWFLNLNLMREAQVPNLSNPLNLGIFPTAFRYAGMLQNNHFAKKGNSFPIAEKVAPVSQRHGWPLVYAQIPFTGSFQSFIACRDLAKQGTGQLRRQTEFLAHDSVKSAVQPIRVQFFGRKNLPGNPTSRSQVADNNSVHVRRVGQLYLDCADCFQYNLTIT